VNDNYAHGFVVFWLVSCAQRSRNKAHWLSHAPSRDRADDVISDPISERYSYL
jgi:hypothetical protein